jgi:ATP-dependent Clp protease ATP-binding subunit ClpC
VRRKPYSVLLLDEIEKAHPDVFNILLQILEDGRLTDAQGRTVDFRNSIVIMTSNIGASEIAKNTGIGFTVGDETGLSYDDMKNRIMGELKKVFRPEFINRIDEVIVFHKLTREEISTIVELLLKRIRESLAERELSLNLSEGASDLLVEKGWDPSMGARPLRRAIQRYIEDPLADEVLSQSMPPGSTVEVDRLSEDERAQLAENSDGDVREMKITITKPKERKRETVTVGGQGDAREEGSSDDPNSEASPDLPDEPEVLPDVPDAPPAPEAKEEE